MLGVYLFFLKSILRELRRTAASIEKLEQVAQRGGQCPIPGNIQGQVGRGSE